MDWEDRKWNEADVMAELVHRLKLAGENVRCEVKLPSSCHRSGFMRADVVVIRNGKIAFVIEVKDQLPVYHITAYDKRRQTKAYEEIEQEHGIPVIWVHGQQTIDRAMALVAGQAEAA